MRDHQLTKLVGRRFYFIQKDPDAWGETSIIERFGPPQNEEKRIRDALCGWEQHEERMTALANLTKKYEWLRASMQGFFAPIFGFPFSKIDLLLDEYHFDSQSEEDAPVMVNGIGFYRHQFQFFDCFLKSCPKLQALRICGWEHESFEDLFPALSNHNLRQLNYGTLTYPIFASYGNHFQSWSY
jgi:hypothetical protein